MLLGLPADFRNPKTEMESELGWVNEMASVPDPKSVACVATPIVNAVDLIQNPLISTKSQLTFCEFWR